MNEDIVPGLLANIEDDFKKSFQSDDTLKTLYGKVQDGTATQVDGEKFSHELGRLTAEVFHRNVTPEILPDGTLYYNIANRIITPILGNNHDIVCEVMKQVIERMNHDAGLGIKFQEPEFEFRRVHDLVWKASLDKYEKTQKMVETGLDTFTRSVADDCVRTNAEFQYEAGLSPKIVRVSDGDCCSWCADMEDIYEYASVTNEVFGRHANCGCTIEFLPGDGRRQNVHTKDWTSETESAMINSEGFTDDERALEKLEKRKEISSSGMDYRPLTFVEPEKRKIGPFEEIFVNRKLDAGSFQIYLSEKLRGKQRVAHEYEVLIKRALSLLGPTVQQFQLPEFVIVGDTELDSSRGRYSGDYNRVMYSPFPSRLEGKKVQSAKAKNMHGVLHELLHWYDYQQAVASGLTFSNDDEFVRYMSTVAKKKLDKLGINEDNVKQISDYARNSYFGDEYFGTEPNYNETYVEYRVKILLGE